MVEKNITVVSSLEARPAALLVQIANKFNASIKIKLDNKYANAKSIMGIISLGVLDGDTVTVIAEGEEEDAAVKELVDYLAKQYK